MPKKHKVMFNEFDRPSRCTREVLVEQILWLIRLRWIAVVGIVAAVLVGSYVFPYPLLPTATGLGLFISYNLVSEVDGTIAMESEPGKGTTVIIRIPIRPKKDLIGGNDSGRNFTNSTESIKEGNA